MSNSVVIEDFATGQKLGSPGRTLTHEDLRALEEIVSRTRSRDERYEVDGHEGFGILDGLLLVAISSGLMFRAGSLALPPTTELLWSIRDARFTGSLTPGSTVRLESEVISISNVDAQRGLLGVRHRAFDEGESEIFAFTTQMVVPRRGTAEEDA